MRVVFLAAGAGGMYCGSCLRDNRLAATLIAQGRDVVLVPLYTPLRTDEEDVSLPRVYYGGVNVFLQQKSAFFRRTPRFLDRLLDARPLFRVVNLLATRSRPEELGALTASVLRGEDGAQAKELDKLIDGLAASEPDIINLPNLMFLGVARRLKERLECVVVCTLGGEDIFLDQLPEPYRRQAFDLIEERSGDVDGFIAVTRYYASHAASHFHLSPERVHYVPLGIAVEDFSKSTSAAVEPFTIGYLARICPEKGLAVLCKAFVELRRAGRTCRLRVAGYRATGDRLYLADCRSFLRGQGVEAVYEDLGELDRAGKFQFLRSLHVLSVPTVYPEAKGLYVLEAMASGIPVVQPRHGSFPELIEATGGGLLYNLDPPGALAEALATLMDEPALRDRLAESGRESVPRLYSDRVMAERTWKLFERLREEGR